MIYISWFRNFLAIVIIIFNVGFIWMIYEGPQALHHALTSTGPSRQEITDEFIENRERFEKIAQYVDQIERNVTIEPSLFGYTLAVYDGNKFRETDIKSKQVHENIKVLFKKLGYEKIVKEDAGIYFTRYTTWGYSLGIAFSSEKHKPFRYKWMTLTPISDDWFDFQASQFSDVK